MFPESRLRSPCALVVDGCRDNSRAVGVTLRDNGFETRHSASAAGAIESLDGWAPDVVFMELSLPGADGCDLAKRICQSLANRPLLVAMCRTARELDVERVREAGFNHFFLKPIDQRKLGEVIRRPESRRTR